MPEATIKSARITYPPTDRMEMFTQDFFQARVHVDFTDGQEDVHILSFYHDELTFSEHEFIGLTASQVHQLFHEKDIRYLRS